MDLSTKYMRMKIKNPLIASASPISGETLIAGSTYYIALSSINIYDFAYSHCTKLFLIYIFDSINKPIS